MTEYERQLFKGKCPYTDEPCNKDIDCFYCKVEQEERSFMEEIERLNEKEAAGDLLNCRNAFGANH